MSTVNRVNRVRAVSPQILSRPSHEDIPVLELSWRNSVDLMQQSSESDISSESMSMDSGASSPRVDAAASSLEATARVQTSISSADPGASTIVRVEPVVETAPRSLAGFDPGLGMSPILHLLRRPNVSACFLAVR